MRHFSAPKLHDKLRITVGAPKQNQRLLKALQGFLADSLSAK